MIKYNKNKLREVLDKKRIGQLTKQGILAKGYIAYNYKGLTWDSQINRHLEAVCEHEQREAIIESFYHHMSSSSVKFTCSIAILDKIRNYASDTLLVHFKKKSNRMAILVKEIQKPGGIFYGRTLSDVSKIAQVSRTYLYKTLQVHTEKP